MGDRGYVAKYKGNLTSKQKERIGDVGDQYTFKREYHRKQKKIGNVNVIYTETESRLVKVTEEDKKKRGKKRK